MSSFDDILNREIEAAIKREMKRAEDDIRRQADEMTPPAEGENKLTRAIRVNTRANELRRNAGLAGQNAPTERDFPGIGEEALRSGARGAMGLAKIALADAPLIGSGLYDMGADALESGVGPNMLSRGARFFAGGMREQSRMVNEYMQPGFEDFAPGQELEDIGYYPTRAGEVPRYLAGTVPEFAVQFSPTIAAGVAGGVPGALGVGFLMETAGHYDMAYDAFRNRDGLPHEEANIRAMAEAGTYGIIATALERIPAEYLFNRVLPGGVPWLRATIEGFIREGGTEAAQEIVQGIISNITGSNPEDAEEIIGEGIRAFIGGGIVGGAAGGGLSMANRVGPGQVPAPVEPQAPLSPDPAAMGVPAIQQEVAAANAPNADAGALPVAEQEIAPEDLDAVIEEAFGVVEAEQSAEAEVTETSQIVTDSEQTQIDTAEPEVTQTPPAEPTVKESLTTEPAPQQETPDAPPPGVAEVSQPATPATAPAEAQATSPQRWLADQIVSEIIEPDSAEALDNIRLTRLAGVAYGTTRAEGGFDIRNAYDAQELAMNLYARRSAQNPAGMSVDAAKSVAADLEQRTSRLATQSVRDQEQIQFQQFSTPPAYAWAANWVANPTPNDVMLEPSAGIGGLAVWAKNAGAQVNVNEISDRRIAMLREQDFDGVTKEDADHIHAILGDKIKPTLVVMNPPFSQSAGKLKGKKDLEVGSRQIEEALKMLQPGGRLVAIVGRGMEFEAPRHRDWWRRIREAYNVRANVGVGGDVYKKYGTSFATRLLVIDNDAAGTESPVEGEVNSISELIERLEGVRDARTTPRPAQEVSRRPAEPSDQPSRPADAPASQRAAGPVEGVRDATGVPGVREGDSTGRPEAVAPSRPGRSGEQASRPQQPASGDPAVGQQRPVAGEPRSSDAVEGRSSDGDRPAGQPVQVDHRSGLVVEDAPANPARKSDIGESMFSPYKPSKLRIKGAQPHPAPVVESAAMAAVDPPNITYTPNLPAEMVRDGVLSDVQLEAVVYAGQAHERILPSGQRAGFFIGDGTGIGKGREIAGIILDNFRQGRKRAVWVSENKRLFADAQRDWSEIGQDKSAIHDHGKTKIDGKVSIDEGILFTTYDTVKSQPSKGEMKGKNARVLQIVDWLGKDFDGVIAFDEAHNMANAMSVKGNRGIKKPSQRAMAALELQSLLPNARVVYVSATGATEVSNLAYAERLGLWGEGTQFPDRNNFVQEIEMGGLAGMEIVARDMKQLGLYLARSIAYDGGTPQTRVDVERLTHKISTDQQQTYDTVARSWQLAFQNMNAALQATGASEDGRAKGKMRAQFFGAQQRFFSQLLTSMQAPSMFRQIEADLKAGQSVVLQLANTNEAQVERAIERQAEDETMDDLDLSPREMMIEMVRNAWPTQKYEDSVDDDGNKIKVPVVDSNGKPVHDPDQVKKRDAFVRDIATMEIPEGILEQLYTKFGPTQIAEVTGRKHRMFFDQDGKRQHQQRKTAAENKQSVSDFKDGKKRILVFSDAGGTGASYHADNRIKNQQRRAHYVVQAGWRADKAIQGLGRSHRSNQSSAPVVRLVQTDIRGHARFISTIARRLEQFGALVRGQRDAGSTGVFTAADNLETPTAARAIRQFFENGAANKLTTITLEEIQNKLGLELFDSKGQLKKEMPSITQFLNRLLALEINAQNEVFEEFFGILERVSEQERAAGMIDIGMETIKADSIVKNQETVVYQDERTGAETRYVGLTKKERQKILSLDDINRMGEVDRYVRNKKSGRVYALRRIDSRFDTDTGKAVKYVRRHGPVRSVNEPADLYDDASKWETIDKSEIRPLWEQEMAAVDPFITSEVHLITGAILPVWSRLGDIGRQVYRLQTDAGEQLIGRVIPNNELPRVLKTLGASRQFTQTPQELVESILNDNATVVLANGLVFRRSRVGGEVRIEATGRPRLSSPLMTTLQQAGAIEETHNFRPRYFLPGKDAPRILEKLIAANPVVDIEDAGGMQMMRDTKPAKQKGWRSVQPLRIKPYVERQRDTGAPLNHFDVIGAIADAVETAGREITLYFKGVPAGARGAYNPQDRAARVRSKSDIDAAAHEFAHAIQHIVFFSPSSKVWESKLGDPTPLRELKKLAVGAGYTSKPSNGWYSEGWAEFFRLYITERQDTQHQLQGRAPAMLEWFEGRFFKDHPEIAQAVKDARAVAKRYIDQGAKAQAEAMLLAEPQKKSKLIESAKSAFSRRNWITIYDPLDKMEKFAEKELGHKLPTSRRPAKIARAHAMTNDRIADQFAMKGVVVPTTGARYPALNDATKLVPKEQHRDWMIYMLARRMRALAGPKIRKNSPKAARDGGLSFEVADAVVRELETPYFKLAAEKVYGFHDGMLEYIAVHSPAGRRMAEAIRNSDPGDYVPLQRAWDRINSALDKQAGSGQIVGSDVIKALRGSDLQVQDLMTSMITQASSLIKYAHQRQVADAFLSLARLEGMGRYMIEVPQDQIPIKLNAQGVARALEEMGATVDAQGLDLDGEALTFWMPTIMPRGGATVLENGLVVKNPIMPIWDANKNKAVWMVVPQDVYDAMTEISRTTEPGALHLALLPFAVAGKALRMGAVGVNESFAFFLNPVRDFGTYLFQTQSRDHTKVFTRYFKNMRAAALAIVDTDATQTKAVELYNQLGISKANFLGQFTVGNRSLRRRLLQATPDARVSDADQRRKARVVRFVDPRNIFDGAVEAFQWMENTARMAEVENKLDELGKQPGDPLTIDELVEIKLAGKVVTTNFTDMGWLVKAINAFNPFFNAQIQGPRAGYMAFRRNPALVSWKMAIMAGLTLLLWAANRDEEWFRELAPHEKARFWFIPTPFRDPAGHRVVVRIPKPFEWGTMAATIPEEIADLAYRQDPERFGAVMDKALDQSIPGLNNPLLMTILEQFANKRFYFDSPIESFGDQFKEPRDRHNEFTSRAARIIGDVMNWSPKRIDHVIQTNTAGLGHKLLGAVGLGRPKLGREFELADIPAFGAAFKRGGAYGNQPDSIRRLYREAEQARVKGEGYDSPEQTERRALLNDAAAAISALNDVRREAKTIEQRRKLTKEALDIARDALDTIERGAGPADRRRLRSKRRDAEKRRQNEGGSR